MKRLMFAAFAAALASAHAYADDSIASLRQPAIDKCVVSLGTGADAATAEPKCTCLVDGIIAAIPGEDGVKMLKLMVADPTSDAEAAAAMGVSEAEAKAFIENNQSAINSAAMACLK